MKNFFSLSVWVIALSIVLFSCGGGKSKPLQESVSSFLNGNEAIIGFGFAKVNDILNKSGYEEEDKLKAFLGEPIGQLKNSINLDKPIYFAIEGPIVFGNPTATYLFLEVKNRDSLKANLTKNGFEIKKGNDFDFLSDGDMNLAFNDHLVVGIIKSDVKDAKVALSEVFSKFKGDVSTGYVADILSRKDDVVYGVSLANLYGTSNTDLADLSEDKQKELRSMLQNSFVENGLRFEDGAIVLETKNHFSDALKNKMFFNKDSGAKILSNLGNGKPILGLSMNFDTKKLNEFFTEYSPNAMKDLSNMIGGDFANAMALANYDVSKLIDGKIGALIFAEGASFMEGVTPDFNFFVGLSGHGKTFGSTISQELSKNFKVVNLTNEGIFGATSPTFAGNSVVLPEGGANFGTNTFNFFLDLESVDPKEFQFSGPTTMIELVKYINIDYGVEGGRITIKARDGKENALKQILKKSLGMVEGLIGNQNFL